MNININNTEVIKYFASMKDPRVERTKKHLLSDIFIMSLSAILSGCDDWVMVANYCKQKEDWFTKNLGLKHGTPSHDTFGNVFAALDNNDRAIASNLLSMSVFVLNENLVIFY